MPDVGDAGSSAVTEEEHAVDERPAAVPSGTAPG